MLLVLYTEIKLVLIDTMAVTCALFTVADVIAAAGNSCSDDVDVVGMQNRCRASFISPAGRLHELEIVEKPDMAFAAQSEMREIHEIRKQIFSSVRQISRYLVYFSLFMFDYDLFIQCSTC